MFKNIIRKFYIKFLLFINKKTDYPIYLFLDYDGVLNIMMDDETEEYRIAMETNNYASRPIVKRIEKLCLDYDLKIIISSSWRYFGLEECRRYLLDAGIDEDVCFYDLTVLNEKGREDNIFEYLLTHKKFSGFLILDDIPMTYLKDYSVQTDLEHGYTESRDSYAREKILGQFKHLL